MEKIVQAAFLKAKAAINEGRIPCCALGLINSSGERAVQFHGLAQKSPISRPLERETLFDLASLTKVIFTTTAILQEVEKGNVALDVPLAQYIPDLRQYDLKAPERALTIRQCLTHQTFLPPVEPIYSLGLDPLTMRAYILQREWDHGPPKYSDINFLMLGIVLERVRGIPLIEQIPPRGTTFTPDISQTAASEFCTWRNRMIVGEVHDENAFAFGGASGHAGLFGNIDAVLDFCFDILNSNLFNSEILFKRESEQRALGYEIKYPEWSGGQGCSQNTIGHLGFTGTGLWIDPERKIAWSLLTNRVHPSRHFDSGIVKLRKEISEEVILEFDKS